MAQANRTRNARLQARITASSLAIVKRAAELQGRSVSDFVVAAAEKSARKTIEETYIIQLSIDDQRRFAKMLIDPPPLSSAMERAGEVHARLLGESAHAALPG